MVEDGGLSAGHARALLGVRTPKPGARGHSQGAECPPDRRAGTAVGAADATCPAPDPNVAALERELARRLGLHVSIRGGGRRHDNLRYSRAEQLEAILRRLA